MLTIKQASEEQTTANFACQAHYNPELRKEAKLSKEEWKAVYEFNMHGWTACHKTLCVAYKKITKWARA